MRVRCHIYIRLGIFVFTSMVPGIKALTCHQCWADDSQCSTGIDKDKMETCQPGVRTCLMAAGLRPEKKAAATATANSTKLVPMLSRRCSRTDELMHDILKWTQANANGNPAICFVVNRSSEWGTLAGFADRRCICGEEKCNKLLWDDVMILPLLTANQSAKEAPIKPVLGANALQNINNITLLSDPSNANNSDQDPLHGLLEQVKTTTGPVDTTTERPTTTEITTTSTTTTPKTTATAAAKPAESGGSSTGLIIGAAVGGVILIGLIGFGVYWLKFRKRRGSSDSGDSDTSGDD